MFVLLAGLYILALGKTVCQTRETHEVQYLPSPFLPGRVNLPRHFHRSTTPSPYQYLPQTTEKSNVSATILQTTVANQPTRKLFVSRVESRKMDQNRPYTATNSTGAQQSSKNSSIVQNNTSVSTAQNIRSNTTGQNNSDIYDQIVFKEDPPMDINNISSEGPAQAANGSSPGPSEQKAPVTEPVPPGNVTVEDRSSFDGDQCPTGYVRVNGICVQPD